jgi:Ca-activated chloride channel family protein
VPVRDQFSGRTFYQNIRVEVDEKTLREIAAMTNAQYYRATDGKSLSDIFEQIDKMEKSTVELDQYKQYRDLFPWFLGAGFAMIALQAMLGQTWLRRLP